MLNAILNSIEFTVIDPSYGLRLLSTERLFILI